MDINSKLSILSLLERPCEPVFIPKGRDNVCFDLPPERLPERFKPYATEIAERFSDDTATRIRVKDIPLPDLSVPLGLERDKQFSIFFPEHRKMAASLINTFMNMRTFDQLLAVAACSRDHLNQQMFFYALSVALLHRNDTNNLSIPSLFQVFPACFFNSGVFPKLKEQASIVSESSRIPIEIHRNYTATDLEPENRLAYFREDIGVNSHHWHWHLVYPHSAENIEIVNKDRRGELFYFMHQQMLGRYNIARLCAKLERVKQIKSLKDPEAEAYFPKLNAPEASGTWASRPKGLTVFQDINRPIDGAFYKLEEVERWKERIYLAIDLGNVTTDKGEIIKLTVDNGIDVLGNIVEASDLSPNRQIYGDLHNAGHAMISSCHDPDGRHLEGFGAMGNVTTAMRDPFFYRWHTMINDIFVAFKNTLPPYTDAELNFPEIEIINIRLTTPDVRANTLLTFWSKSSVDLSRGLDFEVKGDLLVKLTHLNHANFKYEFMVLNNSSATQTGTVRVFIGPKLDERGLHFDLRSQMHLMIAMDKFVATFKPGDNSIERSSTDSSLTISFDTIFQDIDKNSTVHNDQAALDFCGCGWPHHMLVPIGTEGGYPMEMFVMITNHEDDLVEQPSPSGCRSAAEFCGLRDRKYPDARAMGYPFDRKPPSDINTLSAFLKPNMALTDITVKFTDTVLPRSPATA